MSYFLSYVVNKNPGNIFGHASLVLTEHTPPDEPCVICKVGFWGDSQVSLAEDWMYAPKERYTFQHKTYPITQEEMTKFFHKVNSDRVIGDKQRKYNLDGDNYDTAKQPRRTLKGPEYDLLRFNCKTYALSVLREVGIVDHSLSNWLIDIPILSHEPLHDFRSKIIDSSKTRIWTNPMVVSKRAKSQTLEGSTPEEIEKMNLSIMSNEYLNAFEDLTSLLNNSALNKVKGVDELKKSIESIDNTTLYELRFKGPNKALLKCIQDDTQSAIKKFEQSIENEPYGLGTKLLDVFKRVANYLSGGQYDLSSGYTAKQVLHSYQKLIKNTAEKQIEDIATQEKKNGDPKKIVRSKISPGPGS